VRREVTRMVRNRKSAAVLPLLLVVSCGQERVDLPEPPDLSPVVKRYDKPTAPLTEESIGEILPEKEEVLATFDDLGHLDPVVQTFFSWLGNESKESALLLAEDGVETQHQGVEVGDSEFEGEGYVEIFRICSGWDAQAPVSEETNGKVKLTAVFSEEGFDPVFWGEAESCRQMFEGHKILVDGKAAVHTGGLLQGEADAVLTVTFDGSVDVDGKKYDISFDFRLVPSIFRTEISLSVNEGNLVYFMEKPEEDASPNVLGFVASNGVWTCNFAIGGACENKKTGEIIELSL